MTTQKSEQEQREQKALVKAVNQVAVLPAETQEAMTLGRVFAVSGFFPDVTSAAQATVKILAGREMGFEPLYSMRNVYIIPGRGNRPPQVYVSTEAYGAKLRAAGVEFEPVEETPDRCELRFRYRGQEHNVTYTMQQAKRSGVVRDSGAWTERPDWMLYKQCLRNGARQYFQHVIAGMELVADEAQAEMDAQAGVQRPMCERHGVAMRQAKTGHWYCPTLINGQYCTYQAPKPGEAETVDISDAAVIDGEFEDVEYLPEPASPEQVAADMNDLFGDPPKPASPPSGAQPTVQAPTPAARPVPAGGQPGDYRQARGAALRLEGSPRAEAIIREGRDAVRGVAPVASEPSGGADAAPESHPSASPGMFARWPQDAPLAAQHVARTILTPARLEASGFLKFASRRTGRILSRNADFASFEEMDSLAREYVAAQQEV